MIEIESNDSSEYRVRDIYEAAYLYAAGQSLLGLEKSQNFYFFVFTNKTTSLLLRDEFWHGQGNIAPKQYADAVKFLKQQVFQDSGGGPRVY